MARYTVQTWGLDTRGGLGWQDLSGDTPGMEFALEGMPKSFESRKEAERAIRMLRTFGADWRDSKYRIVPTPGRDPKDPWAPAAAVKKRMTPAQKKALAAYRFALQQEDRYLGSVFANATGQKRYEAMTQAAYNEAKRLGLGIEHGL
jgi:hypothetical protein